MQETDIKLLESKIPDALKLFKDKILAVEGMQQDVVITIKNEAIRDFISYLKNDPNLRFDMMIDLFATDYDKFPNPQPERFCVTYQLFSLFQKGRIFIKLFVPLDGEVDSIHDIYAAANWFEREAWDLYGIKFRGHPNLIRILCHNEFVGHPLRKDYPSTQYQQLKTATSSSGM